MLEKHLHERGDGVPFSLDSQQPLLCFAAALAASISDGQRK